jgi:hypothetical protein
MKEIPLTRGYVALVDDADFDWLSQFSWQAVLAKRKDGSIRDVHARRGDNSIKKHFFMHREILGATNPKLDVDHKDRNGLNNQRGNLRLATRSQNSANGRHRINNKSGFKGVYWDGRWGKWQAQITAKGKLKHLGYFVDKQDAANAYKTAAKLYFGEFANVS